MWVDFDQLALDSRVWIFQTDRLMNAEEELVVDSQVKGFISQWASHGASMHASHIVLHHCFVVIAADEQKQSASGCSIDSSMVVFKQLEKQLRLSFFDRFAIAYNDGEQVKVVKQAVFKGLIAEGMISENTIVFNNLISSKEQFLNTWELPIKESWHKRYL